MGKNLFSKFMQKEVVQKTIIFADTFNLNINGWKLANTLEHPYRIVFYNQRMLVGFIDLELYDFGENVIKSDMPFTLFTPIGKVTGIYSTSQELFRYSIEKNYLKEMTGLFKIQKSQVFKEHYLIETFATLEDIDENRTKVIFSKFSNGYTIEITRNTKTSHETVRVGTFGGNLTIEHFDYPKFNERRYLAKIKLERKEYNNKIIPASFEFLNETCYQKYIEIKNRESIFIPSGIKIEFLDYDILGEEIKEQDSRMYEFIDEIRQILTFLANGITPISLYDKLAQLSFYKESDKFKLDFTRAQEVDITLNNNLILKKMNAFKRKH